MKRPYATHYYRGGTLLQAQGACASPEGAVRATVVRIFLGQYDKAVVVDRRNGVPQYTVTINGANLRVHYGGR